MQKFSKYELKDLGVLLLLNNFLLAELNIDKKTKNCFQIKSQKGITLLNKAISKINEKAIPTFKNKLHTKDVNKATGYIKNLFNIIPSDIELKKNKKISMAYMFLRFVSVWFYEDKQRHKFLKEYLYDDSLLLLEEYLQNIKSIDIEAMDIMAKELVSKFRNMDYY